MAVSSSNEATSVQPVAPLDLSDHARTRLRYDNTERCLDRSVISEAIVDGDWQSASNRMGDTAIFHEVAGITFKVIVDSIDRVVITAYPVEMDRFEAVQSNQWTQEQIRSVEERVAEGLTELI